MSMNSLLGLDVKGEKQKGNTKEKKRKVEGKQGEGKEESITTVAESFPLELLRREARALCSAPHAGRGDVCHIRFEKTEEADPGNGEWQASRFVTHGSTLEWTGPYPEAPGAQSRNARYGGHPLTPTHPPRPSRVQLQPSRGTGDEDGGLHHPTRVPIHGGAPPRPNSGGQRGRRDARGPRGGGQLIPPPRPGPPRVRRGEG
ncbi:unnamed protein product [Arctogadus glacialis]